MKNWVLSFALAATIGFPNTGRANTVVCAGLFSGAGTNLSQDASWRQDSTQPSQSGGVAVTTAEREAEIQKWEKHMYAEIAGIAPFTHGDIPAMEFLPEAGVSQTYLVHSVGLNGLVTRMVLGNVGPSGKVKGTILLPVSGHVGFENAKVWRKTDTYTLKRDVSRDREGLQWNDNHWGVSPTEHELLTDIKSLDFVTKQELELQLEKDRVVRVLYYRGGSGGPSGYWEGRVMEFVWDGT